MAAGILYGVNKVEGEAFARKRHVTAGYCLNTLHGLGVWDICVETIMAVGRVEAYGLTAKMFNELFATEGEKAVLEKLQRSEVKYYRMDPNHVPAPTKYGKPLFLTCFTTVELSLIQVSGALNTSLYPLNDQGAPRKKWLTIDLIEISSGQPYNAFWRYKTGRYEPEHNEMVRGSEHLGAKEP